MKKIIERLRTQEVAMYFAPASLVLLVAVRFPPGNLRLLEPILYMICSSFILLCLISRSWRVKSAGIAVFVAKEVAVFLMPRLVHVFFFVFAGGGWFYMGIPIFVLCATAVYFCSGATSRSEDA